MMRVNERRRQLAACVLGSLPSAPPFYPSSSGARANCSRPGALPGNMSEQLVLLFLSLTAYPPRIECDRGEGFKLGRFGVPWAVLVPRFGATVRRDASRGLQAWRGSGVGLAPRPSKRGCRQNRRGEPLRLRRRGMLARGAAGLSTQARLRRRMRHEGGGDVTRRRPGGWPSRWRHRARSRSRSLGARRRLLAPSHDWRALLAAAVLWRREHFARLRAGPELWRREHFARLRAGPDGASGGLLATPLSRRASSTAPARHACPRRSSDRPACLLRRGFDVGCCSKAAAT